MNKYIILIFIILIFSTSSYSQNIGAIYLGMDEVTKKPDYSSEKIQSGVTFGIMIPINVKNIDCHYKIGLMKAKSNEGWYNEYILYHNHLLIGKNIKIANNYKILPQCGIGYTIGNYYNNLFSGDGIYRDGMSLNLVVQLQHILKCFGVGLMFSYIDNNFFNNNYLENRLNISLIFFK